MQPMNPLSLPVAIFIAGLAFLGGLKFTQTPPPALYVKASSPKNNSSPSTAVAKHNQPKGSAHRQRQPKRYQNGRPDTEENLLDSQIHKEVPTWITSFHPHLATKELGAVEMVETSRWELACFPFLSLAYNSYASSSLFFPYPFLTCLFSLFAFVLRTGGRCFWRASSSTRSRAYRGRTAASPTISIALCRGPILGSLPTFLLKDDVKLEGCSPSSTQASKKNSFLLLLCPSSPIPSKTTNEGFFLVNV
ncbi:hypothetical protein QOT17_012574 [Balamuthia mandrillaris]